MHRNYYSDDVPAKENRTWQRETTATSFNAFPGYEKDPRYTLHPPHLTSQAHNAVPPLTDSVQGGQAYNVTFQPPAPPNTPTFPGRPLNSASHLAPDSRYPSQTNFDPSVPGSSVTYAHPYGGASEVQSSRPHSSPRQQYQSEYGDTSVAQNQSFVSPNPDFNRLQELLQPEKKELGSVLNWLEIEAQQRNRLQDEETRDPFVVQYPDQNETYEMRSQRNWRSGRSQHGRFGGHTSGRGRSEWRTGRGNYSRQNRNLGHSADHFQDQALQASSATVTQQQWRRSTGLLTIPKISQQVQEPVAIPGLDTASATNSSQTRLPDSICGENANFHELTGNLIVISQDREGRVDEVRTSKPGLGMIGPNTDPTAHHPREVPTSANGLVEEPSADKQAAVNDLNAQQRQSGDVSDRDQTVTVKPRPPNRNLWLTRPPIRPEDQKEWRSKKTLDEYRMFQEEVIKPRMDAFKSGQVVPRDPTITGTRWRTDGPRKRYVNGGWSRSSTKLDNAEDSLCSGRAAGTEEQSEGQSEGQWQQPEGQHSSIVQAKAANSATGTYINGLGTLVSTTSQMSSASSENTSTLSFDSYHATGTVDASGYPAQDFSGQANGNPYHQGYFVQNQAIHNGLCRPFRQ
ncbi:hypothetical protein K435DRAFT_197592 [Dendrothele bispora CBS 962.96]|uniref:Uncharacterized protein n=1 Tax=Dendrothele bispora (strain CBS 962.96) TaxID=1314807 RepID=A0A4S8LUI6_DENBC|nr:hypothetical protein K435DRAFT_197592 [Dendrothele bispora CBS 962.96]